MATMISRYRETELWKMMRESNSQSARDELILRHLNLVKYIAGQFCDNNISFEDLVQVGTIGLINAVDRFDPDRGIKFSTFATPTITGEIKHYFRDKRWPIKVTRKCQDLYLDCHKVANDLSLDLESSTAVVIVAQKLEVPEQDVLTALNAGRMSYAKSFDQENLLSTNNQPQSSKDYIGQLDNNIMRIEKFDDLRVAINKLKEPSRSIIIRRFFFDQTQIQISKTLGASQSRVSTLIKEALSNLRNQILAN